MCGGGIKGSSRMVLQLPPPPPAPEPTFSISGPARPHASAKGLSLPSHHEEWKTQEELLEMGRKSRLSFAQHEYTNGDKSTVCFRLGGNVFLRK